MPPQGAAFLILYASTAPGDSIHWMADSMYTFSNSPPWFPDDKPEFELLTKANSVIDNNYAAVFMTPLNPSVRTNVTFTATSPGAHNFTLARVYTVHVPISRCVAVAELTDPERNETRTTATRPGASTVTGAVETTAAIAALSAKSSPAGAIAGGVVRHQGGSLANCQSDWWSRGFRCHYRHCHRPAASSQTQGRRRAVSRY